MESATDEYVDTFRRSVASCNAVECVFHSCDCEKPRTTSLHDVAVLAGQNHPDTGYPAPEAVTWEAFLDLAAAVGVLFIVRKALAPVRVELALLAWPLDILWRHARRLALALHARSSVSRSVRDSARVPTAPHCPSLALLARVTQTLLTLAQPKKS